MLKSLFLSDAPWCVHCIDLEKDWRKAAKIAEIKLPDVKFAKIDGSKNEKLVEDMKIEGYPGIIFTYNHGTRTIKYDGKQCIA